VRALNVGEERKNTAECACSFIGDGVKVPGEEKF
jgi:hypothetical protein